MVLCEANYGSGGNSTYPSFTATTTSGNSHETFTQNITPPTGVGTVISSRPNIRMLLSQPGCTSPRVPLYVTVNPQPSVDAGVVSITAPSTAVNLTDHQIVTVNVKNYGSTPIYDYRVTYQIDNNTPITEHFTTDTILPNATKSRSLTQTGDFGTNGVTYQITAYTVLANDATALNDTAHKSVTN